MGDARVVRVIAGMKLTISKCFSGQEIIKTHSWVECPDKLESSAAACIQVLLDGRDTIIPLNYDREVGSNHLGLRGASDDGNIVIDVLADKLFEHPALAVRFITIILLLKTIFWQYYIKY